MEAIKKIFRGLFHCFTINADNYPYKIISYIGFIFRVLVLPYIIPNFFEMIFSLIIPWAMPKWLFIILSHLFLFAVDILGLSHIVHFLSYQTTGFYYENKTKTYHCKSLSIMGSIFYNVYYTLYTAIPVILISWFYWWVILIVGVVYIGVSVGIFFLARCTYVFPGNGIFYFIGHILMILIALAALWTIYHFYG